MRIVGFILNSYPRTMNLDPFGLDFDLGHFLLLELTHGVNF